MTLIDRLTAFFDGADSPTERQSTRNGLFSYAGEWHSFIVGLGAGTASMLAGQPELATVVVAYALGEEVAAGKSAREIVKEPWYGIGGVIVGLGVGLVLRLLV